MQPSNWSTLGWFTLQDWDTNRELVKKHVLGAMRQEAPDDPEDIIPRNLTEGHLLGGMHWPEIDRDGIDAWWITPAAVSYYEPGGDQAEEEEEEEILDALPPFDGKPAPALPVLSRPEPLSDADKATLTATNPLAGEPGPPDQTTTRRRGGGWSALIDANKTDPSLPAKKPRLPGWAKGTKFPVGWIATILSGSRNVDSPPQDEILLPGFYGLVAPNRGGTPAMGTTVWELNQDKVPDFGANLQSMFSIEKVGKGNALALQLGKAKIDASSGYMLLSDWSDGEGVLASASVYQGGPLLTGGRGDQHRVGTTGDGKQINAAHLSTATIFKGPGFDCPLLFEASAWPKPDSGPHKILVHLVNDVEAVHPWAKGAGVGYGRWYADAFFYADDPPPEDGPGLHGPEDPFGTGPPKVGGGDGGVTGGDGGVVGGGGGVSGGGGVTGGGGTGTTGGGFTVGPGVSDGLKDDPGLGESGGGFSAGPGVGDTLKDDPGLGASGGAGSGPGGGDEGGDGGDTGPPGPFYPGTGDGGELAPLPPDAAKDGGSVVFIKDADGNLNPVVPPGGMDPDELKEWIEKRWGKDPPYTNNEGTAVQGEIGADRPKWAAATNTVAFGGGIAERAQAYEDGERDLSGSSAVSDWDRHIASLAPVVAMHAAWAKGDGTWEGWDYVSDGGDGDRTTAAGGTMLIPPDVTTADVMAGTANSGIGAVTQAFPEGMGQTGWGRPSADTGGIVSGVIGRATPGGGFELTLVNAAGAEVGVKITMGEGGLGFSGKASFDDLIDPPTGIVLAEQSSRPANWTTNFPGLYAGDTAGANEAWWVRDDGTEIDLAAGVAGGVSALHASIGGTVGNTGGGADTLKTYQLPANTVGAAGDTLRITAWGQIAIGAKNCRVFLRIGGESLTSFTTATNSIWRLEAFVKRTGAATSQSVVTREHSSVYQFPTLGSETQDFTGALDIIVTGENLTDATNNAVDCDALNVELISA